MAENTYTIRWSADRTLYFVEPKPGENVRGYWLTKKRNAYPIEREMIKGAYSGAVEFDGYWRRWFSMRGFGSLIRQGVPQTGASAENELVRDYLSAERFVTLEQLDAEAAEQAAREKAAHLAAHRDYKLAAHETRAGAAEQSAPAAKSNSHKGKQRN